MKTIRLKNLGASEPGVVEIWTDDHETKRELLNHGYKIMAFYIKDCQTWAYQMKGLEKVLGSYQSIPI